ncbi:uncharacterized protein BDR25DRAFT_367368 [Lindgomyces ingoldianus]|uniref:Uncharacterized protein n=1 Tax=Lindgomyces ingoldianus TaxID=673940 RepID=A0ACB6QX84_9PLEO|nr:uncharacterized protein BDR25DRAFT_367368 [Lindgomyces ingoldianus]KAF2471633.1 hypothetical protein BDR25DRAFT_367368 [Lindgomyces ingoldianus]
MSMRRGALQEYEDGPCACAMTNRTWAPGRPSVRGKSAKNVDERVETAASEIRTHPIRNDLVVEVCRKYMGARSEGRQQKGSAKQERGRQRASLFEPCCWTQRTSTTAVLAGNIPCLCLVFFGAQQGVPILHVAPHHGRLPACPVAPCVSKESKFIRATLDSHGVCGQARPRLDCGYEKPEWVDASSWPREQPEPEAGFKLMLKGIVSGNSRGERWEG